MIVDRLNPYLPARWRRDRPVVPVVRIAGTIGSAVRFRPGLTLEGLAGPLERAFAVRGAPAVALAINSPGGSPVQSHLIHRRIRDLAVEKDRHVIAFVEDVAASGGYMVALAADEIVVDPASIVGSIGVVSAGFGFQGLIEKLGVERRVHTAGSRKAMLDPFEPERPDDVARLEALQRDIHAMFIDLVKARRGERLVESEELFDGSFWTGRSAVALGLADGLGDLRAVLRERYGRHVRPRPMPVRRSLRQRLGLGAALAAPAADAIMAGIEERAEWRRFGL